AIQQHLDRRIVTGIDPPPFLDRIQRWIRRHKVTFAAGSAVTAALLGGLALSTFFFLKERVAHQETRDAKEHETKQRLAAEAAGRRAQAEAERAEKAALEAKQTLARSDFFRAVRFIAEDKDSDALPYLARSLLEDPTNQVVLARLTTLLTYRPWVTSILSFHPGS